MSIHQVEDILVNRIPVKAKILALKDLEKDERDQFFSLQREQKRWQADYGGIILKKDFTEIPKYQELSEGISERCEMLFIIHWVIGLLYNRKFGKIDEFKKIRSYHGRLGMAMDFIEPLGKEDRINFFFGPHAKYRDTPKWLEMLSGE